MNIVLIVDLPALKPHWLSGKTSSAIFLIQFKMIFAKILPAIDSNEMPLWLPHSLLEPFFVDSNYDSIIEVLRNALV